MEKKGKNILITGIAGFIGFHVAKYYANEGYFVVGVDNLNDYYDPRLKVDRLLQLGISFDLNNSDTKVVTENFEFVRGHL